MAEEVSFEVRDTAKTQHVKMVDRPNHTRKSSKGSKTRDDTPVNTLLLLLAAGLTGTAALLYYLFYYSEKTEVITILRRIFAFLSVLTLVTALSASCSDDAPLPTDVEVTVQTGTAPVLISAKGRAFLRKYATSATGKGLAG